MKKILFVNALKNKEAVIEIENALNETRCNFKIDEINKCIVVEGDNDALRACRIIVQELGYQVQ